MHGDISYAAGFATYLNNTFVTFLNNTVSLCNQLLDPADGTLFFGINSINISDPTTTAASSFVVNATALIAEKFLDPNAKSLNVSMFHLRTRYCAAPYNNYFLNLYDGYCYESCP